MNILSTVISDRGTAFRWLVGRKQEHGAELAPSDDKIVEELMGKYESDVLIVLIEAVELAYTAESRLPSEQATNARTTS